jgi:hypothetical protein
MLTPAQPRFIATSWELIMVKQSSIQFSKSQKVLDYAEILLHNDLGLQHGSTK